MAINGVNGVASNSPIQKIVSQPVHKQVPASAPGQVRLHDKVELSGVSHLLKALKTNDIRADKVAEIKARIEAGSYDKDGAKLDVAVDRLLDHLLE